MHHEQAPATHLPCAAGVRQLNEANYRLLVDSVRDYAIFMLDPAGCVRSWNKGAERIKGYAEAEIIGRHFSVFYPHDAAASGRPQALLALAAQNGRYEEEGWRVRKDGSCFWARITLTALRDEQGAIAGYAKVTRDLSDYHAATEALRCAKEELEQRVRERTEQLEREIAERKLGEQRLREFSSHLQRVREQERASIARDIHDDLGGLLTALKMGMSHCRQSQPQTAEGLSQLDKWMALVDSAIGAFRAIIDDLHPSILDTLGLWAALEWSAERFQAATRIRTRCRRNGPAIPVDTARATMVYRLVQEAMTNVARHARATELDLIIRVAPKQATIRIVDNGSGITERDLTNPVAYGLQGMRERARMLGGRLRITGTAGTGTQIELKIPIDPTPSDLQPSQEQAMPANQETPARQTGSERRSAPSAGRRAAARR